MTNSNTSKYIKYAFGEIVLVMVGILLALQINNWNESRKSKKEFNNIIRTIEKDLSRDTLIAGLLINYYKDVEEISLKIINKELTIDSLSKKRQYMSIVSRYRSFNIQTKGYEMANNFSSKNDIKSDSLFTTIVQFYNAFLPIIEDSNEFVKKEVLNNIETYKKYNWYVDWTLGKINNEQLNYFSKSEEYRKQVASHNLLAGKNHLLFITSYKDNAIKVLEMIDKHLNKN